MSGGVVGHRPAVVVQPGPVGGADLDQAGPGVRHHVGDAEAAPDLDQLAPAHHAPRGPWASAASARRTAAGAVVDHQGGLGAAGPGQQSGGVRRGVSPAARCRGRTRGWSSAPATRSASGLGMAQRGPAQVGVQQHAGGVDHPSEQGVGGGLGPGPGRVGIAGGDGLAGGVDEQGLGQIDVGQAPGEGID